MLVLMFSPCGQCMWRAYIPIKSWWLKITRSFQEQIWHSVSVNGVNLTTHWSNCTVIFKSGSSIRVCVGPCQTRNKLSPSPSMGVNLITHWSRWFVLPFWNGHHDPRLRRTMSNPHNYFPVSVNGRQFSKGHNVLFILSWLQTASASVHVSLLSNHPPCLRQ